MSSSPCTSGIMRTVWFKNKRIIGALVSAVLLYLLLKPRSYNHSASVIVPKVHASDVWEFVADFSNMKHLNPTIVDFNILTESGNYDHWKYAVEYTEHLSHWPYVSNFGVAHFDVKALPRQDIYFIFSSHNTCFLGGLFCLGSTSEFKFSGRAYDKGASCEEHVHYNCPPLFSLFCKREVAFQRNAIMNNLKAHFVS